MLASLVHRRLRRTSTLASVSSRIEVCPPAPSEGADRWRDRIGSWLRGGAPLASPAAVDRLEAIKREFADCLGDLEAPQAGAVLMRINTARTLHDLWHLRAPLFGVVARECSQAEAERRLAALARHFPTRTPRSALLPLAD